MVDEAEATAIADRAAAAAGWGGVSSRDYQAVAGVTDGVEVWHIRRRVPVLGHCLEFAVSRADGTVVFRRRRGPR